MRFIAIADTHYRHQNVKLPKGDVLLHAGDVSYKGERAEVADFLQWFSKLNYAYKIFIAGNHDFYFEKGTVADIASMIPENVIYLNDTGVIVNNINIWGSPVTPWFFNWAFNRQRGTEIQKHWHQIPSNTNILITHGPPFGLCDTVINGRHAGCKDLLKKVQDIKPKVHLFGHIHEGYGTVEKNGTKFINASLMNESYELVNKPVVFDM